MTPHSALNPPRRAAPDRKPGAVAAAVSQRRGSVARSLLLAAVLTLLLAGGGNRAQAADPLCQLPDDADPVQLAPYAAEPLPLHRLLRCDWPAQQPPQSQQLRWLLDAGAEVNDSDARQQSALLLALQQLHQQPAAHWRDAALLLLQRGAPVRQADIDGLTPLHLAAADSEPTLTEALLAAGADPLARDSLGRLAIDHTLEHGSHANNFALLFDRSASELSDEEKELLLEKLIQARRAELIDHWLQQVPTLELDPIDASQLLVEYLWHDGDVEGAERYWRAGADPLLVHSQGGGDLPWRLATDGRLAELDWLLAGGLPLNAVPASGFPPLYFANLQASRALLGRGANPNLASRKNGTPAAALIAPPPPFDQGGEGIRPAKLTLLLAHGLDANQRDRQGRTALQYAVEGNVLWLVQALLDAGAEPTLTDDESASLLPRALTTGRLPMVQAIIRHLPDLQQRHPLLIRDYVGSPAPSAELLETLLVAGLSADLAGREGETALLRAARLQRWPLVRLMLRYGANTDASNRQGCSLHCYSWAMPDDLQRQVRGTDAEQNWQWPHISGNTAGFFALAVSPMLGLWLLHLGVRLARRRSLWPGSLWMVFAVLVTLVAGAALFYDCRPCLLDSAAQQSAPLMLLAVLVYATQWIGQLRQRPLTGG